MHNTYKKNESDYQLSATNYRCSGFTLIEIIVAVTILVLISGVVVVSIRVYAQEQALSGAVASIATILSEARTSTLSGNGGLPHGVHFESSSATLFSGESYVEGAAENEVVTLDTRVRVGDISLAGGGDDVVFEKLTGDTADDGTVTLELVSDASRQKIITIQGVGLVSYH